MNVVSRSVVKYGNRSFREIGDVSRFNLTRYKIDADTGCHLWLGAVSDNGYAVVGTNRDGTYRVARVVYTRDKGQIPPGMYTDHLCRNRACINSDHLELVTNAENSRRGSKAKLTWDDIREIRHAAESETYRSLARRFGVSSCAISNIVNFLRWKEVNNE